MIGKAWVKVAPDTDGFRRATIAQLKKELAGLEKDLASDKGRIRIPTEIDVDQARSAQNIKSFLDKIDGRQKVTVKIDFDIDEKLGHLDEVLDGISRRTQTIRPVVEPELDTSRFERDHARLLKETDRLSREATEHVERVQKSFDEVGRASRRAGREFRSFADEIERSWSDSMSFGDGLKYVFDDFRHRAVHNFEAVREKFRSVMDGMRDSKVHDLELDLDLSTFEGNLQRVRHGLQEIKDDFDDTEIEFHPLMDDSSYRWLWARLKWLTRDRFVMIHPVVNRTAAQLAERTLKAITLNATGLRNAGRALKNFFEYLERLDKNAPVLGMIATAVAAIGGAAVAAVGSVSHLAVELTRMAGAGLALPGILGGFAVGIGVMVAALQDFNREVPKVRDDLGRMQDMISDRFWQQAKVPLLDAWNKILPSLEKGFTKTAAALGDWTAAMAGGLADNLRPESMAYMFDNLAASIDIAAMSADDMGRILEVLGKRGSEYLPRLASWTNDVAKGFRNWLDEADRTGRLNDIIDTGITKLKEFGVLVRESGELIYILGSAAERAGFSGLKQMSEGLEQVNESLKRNQDSLDDYFRGAANMADGFKSALGSIIDGLGEFSGTFQTISHDVQSVFEDIGSAFETILSDTNFQTGVTDLFDGISSAIEDLSGVAPQLSDVLGSVGSLAGTVLENIGDVGAQIVDAFGPEVSQVLTDIQPAIDTLSDSLSDLIDTLSGADDDNDLIQSLANIISVASPGLINTAAANIDTLADSLQDLKDVFSGDWGSIDFNLSEMWNNIMRFINPVPFLIGQLAGSSIATAIGNWVSDQIAEIGGWFETLGRWVSEAMASLVTTIGDAWNSFWDWLTDLFSGDGGGSGVANIGLGIFDGLDIGEIAAGLVEKFDDLKERAQEIWDGFWEWLTGLFSGGSDSGGSGGGFDIKFNLEAVDNASAVVSSVGQTIRTWAEDKYEAFLEAVDKTKTAISNAKTAITNWAKQKYEAALTAASKVAAGISSAKNAILAWARGKYEAALKALNRTAPGISAAVSAIRSRVVNATFRAKVTMSNVVSGLSSVVSRIRNAVSNFTARVRTSFANANGNVFNRVQAFANGGITSMTNGLSSPRISHAWENHVAQIAKPGVPYRVWAEPETGGEAYIPLSPLKRERSTAILADVADRFGYRLQRFADGSEPRSSAAVAGGNTYNLNVQTLRPDVASEVTSDVMFHLRHMSYGGGRPSGF